MQALVTPVLRTAVPSLVKLLKYEWALDKTVKEGLTSLEAELRSMQALLENVSSVPAGELDPQVKLWASEVRELSYTIETRIHSYMVRIESTKGTILSSMSKRLINHDIASYIQETKIKIKEVSERRTRYFHSSSTRTSTEKLDPRILAGPTKESDLVGLAGATNELTKMLSKGDNVSIFGMGGLGKTTLARAVYDKMKGRFDCGAFVPIGRSPDAKKVLKDIFYELHTEVYGDAPDEGQLIDQLRKSLASKRCLIVIDDIWDKDTWALINSAFAASDESRIITTTRKLEVADAVGAMYVIKPLSHANSQELLNTKIFGADTKSHDTEFSRLSDKILSKCGGVPIAIITIARLLAKKPREEWSKVYDSIGFGEHGKEDVVKDIRMILSFSYYDLPYHLQRCFLYLSLFPEGHWIEKNMLVWRWVAEGLVPGCNEQMVGSFQLGETYFEELIDRSMIQRAVSPRDLGQGGCRLHDMMLDLIRSLYGSESENFSTVIGTKEERTSQTSTIHRLAIHKETVDEYRNTGPRPEKNPITGLEVGEVLSFYASTCPGSSLPPLSRFARLRVIDLEECDLSVGDCKLKHIGKLTELGYVGLLGTPVAELPKKMGRLKFLQTLDVVGTGIKELPPFISELKKLRCMRAGKGTRMMGPVGELTSLEELWLHSADKSPDLVTELRKLKELRVLVIHFDEMDEGMQEELVESLSMLKKLQVLQIWFDTVRKVRLPCWEESVSFPELRQLLLFGVIQSRPMPWIHFSCVPELTKLLLEVEVLEAQDLEILGQMPSLRSLYLHSEEVNRLSYTASKDEFKVLEYLNTNIELVCGDGAMPRIQELEVVGIKVGTDAGLHGNMPLLDRASYHLDCTGCVPVEIDKADAALRQASQAHPNRPTISIKRFHDFEMTQLNTEAQHHFIESLTGELVSTLELTFPDARGNLRLGRGGQGQANANSTTSRVGSSMGSFVDMFSQSLARNLPSINVPPTLTLVEATADDGSSSPSHQFAGGVPPKRPNYEGHVLLATSSTSQFAEGETQLSAEEMLDFINNQPTAGIMSSMATQVGVEPAAFKDFFKKCVSKPEIIAAANNIKLDANRSASASGISTFFQLMISESIANQEKKGFHEDRMLDILDSLFADDVLMARMDSLRPHNAVSRRTRKESAADARKSLKELLKKPEIVACLMRSPKPDGTGPSASAMSEFVKLAMADLTTSMADRRGRAQGADDTCSDITSSTSAEDSGAGVSTEPLPEVNPDSSEHVDRPSSRLSGMVSGVLRDPAMSSVIVDLAASLMDLVAGSNAKVAQGVAASAESSQVVENFSRMFNFKEMLPAVQQTTAARANSDSAQADTSSMFSSLLSSPALGNLMADLTAQPGFADASMPGFAAGGGHADDSSSMSSTLLSNSTLGTLIADLTAQPGFMNAEANNASVAQGVGAVPESSQDCANLCSMLNNVVPSVEGPNDAGASTEQPSSKADSDGLEEGAPSKHH